MIQRNSRITRRTEDDLTSICDLLGPSLTLKLLGQHLFATAVAEAPLHASRARRLHKLGEKLVDLALINQDL